MTTNLIKKNLISFDDWSKQEINLVLEVSKKLKIERATGVINNELANKTLFMIFFEQSTRTRNSLESGMTQLGGHAHDLTTDKMQITHGETPKDTAKVLSRMGEAIAIRNCFHSIGNKYINSIAENADIPIISMQDDVYHPLQSIADLMTIKEYFGDNLKGLKIAISWAYAESHAKPLSVPQSQILLFSRYGIEISIANPKEFPLDKEIIAKSLLNAKKNNSEVKFYDNMEDATKNADIVIPKNWGGFGYFDEFKDTDDEKNIMKNNLLKYRKWILDEKIYKYTNKAKIMHALPADRGREITNELLDSKNSIIYDEAENRLHTAKALLSLLIK